MVAVVLRYRHEPVDGRGYPLLGERTDREHVRELAEPRVRLGDAAESLAGFLEADLHVRRVLNPPRRAAALSERHAERVLADDARRSVLDHDRRHAVVSGGAEDVLADRARVPAHSDRVRQLAQEPAPDADGTERACRREHRLHVAGGLHQSACDLGELDDLVVAPNDGQVLAGVTADERLAVGDGRDEHVPLDRIVEPRGLYDLVVLRAGGEADAEAVPGRIADVDHLADVVSRHFLGRMPVPH